MSEIKEIPINAIDSQNSGENCSASEPFCIKNTRSKHVSRI